MKAATNFEIRRLTSRDLASMQELLAVFGRAFNEAGSYKADRPRSAYLKKLLGTDSFIALAAINEKKVVGGLAAYELRKFEQERSEIYIYDLAVDSGHRRRGIASGLIRALQKIARARGARVIFVQADYGDDAAIALYSQFGVREKVFAFDITTRRKGKKSNS